MAEAFLEIKTSDLRRVTNLLMSYLEAIDCKTIRIPASYYWFISKQYLYNPLEDPKEFSLGDLFHDWERMEQILQDEEMAVTDAFIWLSGIMRAVGDHTEESK